MASGLVCMRLLHLAGLLKTRTIQSLRCLLANVLQTHLQESFRQQMAEETNQAMTVPMVEAAQHPLDLTHQAVALHLVHGLALLLDQAVVVVAEARRDRRRTHRYRRLCRQGWA